MANICSNTMYVSSEDVRNLEHIRSYMENWAYAQIENIDDETFEVYFDSKWDFPFAAMTEMVEDLPNKDDIYIRVLSIECGDYYCAFHVYEGDVWYNP